jgi:hypothetical protein
MRINGRRLAIGAAVLIFLCGSATHLQAQDDDDTPAITARVHGTFVDKLGGSGVLSGDMFLVRFEVRNGTVTAIGRIKGSLADSTGHVLGLVDEPLAMSVGRIDATCNQLRMDLGATEADVLGTHVQFDAQAGGFDSREGTTPKALAVLCAAAGVLGPTSTPAIRARTLNDIANAVKAGRSAGPR